MRSPSSPGDPSRHPAATRSSRAPAGTDPVESRAHTEAELGAALSISPGAAERRLMTACLAVERFPVTLRALEAGWIDVPRLDGMVSFAGRCTPEVAAQVEAAVLVRGDHGSSAAFRREVRRCAARLDPEGSAARAAESRADRFVRTRPEGEDTAWLEPSCRPRTPPRCALPSTRQPGP